MEETSNTVCWVDIKLAQKKKLKFYHTRSNAIILYNTLRAYCIPKAVRMETGGIIYEKVYASPRPPPKISLRNDWMKELGSEVARQPEGSQPTQPNPNPIKRTGRPVVTEQTSRSSAQEIDTRFSLDCKNTNLFVERLEKDKDTDKDVDADRDRTERPVVKQITIERRDPLCAVIQITSNQLLSALSNRLTHGSLVKGRTYFWKKRQIMIERGNPLFAVMQITSAQC